MPEFASQSIVIDKSIDQEGPEGESAYDMAMTTRWRRQKRRRRRVVFVAVAVAEVVVVMVMVTTAKRLSGGGCVNMAVVLGLSSGIAGRRKEEK